MEKIKYAVVRKKFGRHIKKLRLQKKLTLRQASEKIGIPFGMIALIERGEPTKIRMEFLYQAAIAYEVPPDSLCLLSERIPRDVYYKVAQNPSLWDIIRSYEG